MADNQPEDKVTTNSERLLVIGGGGSRGAWAGGFVRYLTKFGQRPYRYVWGTSTGSLMAPLILLNEFDALKEAYTTIGQKDVFDVNPFKPNGDLIKWRVLWRLLMGKQSFGETNNLRKLICKFFTKNMFEKIRNANPELLFNACSLNFTNGEIEHFFSNEAKNWEEMVDKVWASCNQPLLMTFVSGKFEPKGSYVDGGVLVTVPIIKALEFAMQNQISHIDIVVNTPEESTLDIKYEPAGMLKNLIRVVDFWKKQIQKDNILIGKLLANFSERLKVYKDPAFKDDHIINVNTYYIPMAMYKANPDDLVFDSGKMTSLWSSGEKGKSETGTRYKCSYNLVEDLL